MPDPTYSSALSRLELRGFALTGDRSPYLVCSDEPRHGPGLFVRLPDSAAAALRGHGGVLGDPRVRQPRPRPRRRGVRATHTAGHARAYLDRRGFERSAGLATTSVLRTRLAAAAAQPTTVQTTALTALTTAAAAVASVAAAVVPVTTAHTTEPAFTAAAAARTAVASPAAAAGGAAPATRPSNTQVRIRGTVQSPKTPPSTRGVGYRMNPKGSLLSTWYRGIVREA